MARKSVEDILRGAGRSVDGSHSQSSFLSSSGDFIGGSGSHMEQILKTTGGNLEGIKGDGDFDTILNNFTSKHTLPRVQNLPINRAGEKKLNFGINSKINSTQLKSIKDSEAGGRTIGFSVGSGRDVETGSGFKNLTKSLRSRGFLGGKKLKVKKKVHYK